MSVTGQFPAETATDGSFVRQEYSIRDRITADGSSGFPAEAGRYHLYVSLACPWAHRAIIVRRLLGLEDVISMSVVDPVRDERGWAFREGAGHADDSVCGFQFLSEAYLLTDPEYTGRYTVPCIWDRVTKRLVTNNYPRTYPRNKITGSAPAVRSRLSCVSRQVPDRAGLPPSSASCSASHLRFRTSAPRSEFARHEPRG
jgi:hypothetical protein